MKLLILTMTVPLLHSICFAQVHGHKEDKDHHHDSAIHLGPIQVVGENIHGSFLGTVSPVTNLHGDELFLKSQNTLGETLKNEPGVNSSQFGPSSSRPVIRGLEGDRISILQNGVNILDASAASQDHAVAVNPLASESIEILRGPINLIYGPSAVGGVVNIVNSRIHKDFYQGVFGAADYKHDSVNQSQNLGAKLDYGIDSFMLHFDGQYTKAANTQTPLGEIKNSHMEQHSFALGATYFDSKQNYLGLALQSFNNFYGSVSDPDVDIDLKQERIDLSGYYKFTGFFEALQIKSAQTFYQHTELESGATGTQFKNQGNETRLELVQKKQDSFSGVWGLQTNILNLQATGAEAFLPSTETTSFAFFIFEEYQNDDWTLNASVRGEWSDYQPNKGSLFPTAKNLNFFSGSFAVGARYSLGANFSTGIDISNNERAPSHQEVYAQGAHLALGIYESGDLNLKVERSLGLQWDLKHETKSSFSQLTFYRQDFSNFISLNPTNQFHDTDESGTANDSADDFRIYQYTPTKAILSGLELRWRQQLPAHLSLDLSGDITRGENNTDGRPLPRISPPRLGLGLEYRKRQWGTMVQWRYVAQQNQIGTFETSTPAYNEINLSGDVKFKISNSSLLKLFAQINNLTDVTARNHVSFVKNQVILPGRNISVGARILF